ncbi:MAG: GDP-L-fucose synthase [Candidatus Omnitrophica bacterium]|nr:GDP-L-fucose synthase [Candidatus Omnitrophota bacterium]
MKKNSRIYVAGHTGLIGSGIMRELQSRGYKNILTRTRQELDLTDKIQVEKFFVEEKPEYVFLAAARVGGIYANDAYPAEFMYENIMIQTNVIDLAYRQGVKKLLFLVSSCVYPKFCKQPMKEEYILTGAIEPTNEPFALAKLAGFKMCQAYNRQYKTNFISAIPANVYGINDHHGENAHVLASLIKKFHEANLNHADSVELWGTGTPKREFIYVDDAANGCIFLMQKYDSKDIINIGAGIETSIKEVAIRIKDIVGFKGRIVYDTTKPDGNPRRFLNSDTIQKLGWKPKITLKEGLQLAYEWYRNQR